MPVQDRLIKFCMTIAVLVVAGVAGWVSYFHAVEVIERAGGESSLSAHLLPATIDGLALAASLVMLFAARYNLPVPRLARVAVAMGIGATLAANMLHGIAHGYIAAVIAAWPAVALVMSYELCMWVVAASRSMDRRTVVTIDQAPEEATDLSRVVQLMGEVKEISAAEVGRKLGLRYPSALSLTKQARELIAQAQ